MKLQKLTIHNLTSIEEATIDFEQEPLSGESIFLICGETGAGKTTILDAICLALYNDTPRMYQSANENYRDTNHIFSKSKDSVAINDKRQLMRRNTGEAWVELDFIGTNEIPYTARWYVSCARKKANTTIQSVKWTWDNRQTQTTYTQKGEITAEQAAAIGLSFEQFCRTTLLAQGDFTKFLQSQAKEKSEILEKLTGTEIYSTLGEKIYTLTQEKKQQYELQMQKLAGIQLLTPEEEETLKSRISQQQATAAAYKQQQESIRRKIDWLKKEAELRQTLVHQEADWKQQQEILSSDTFLATDRFIAAWNTGTEARECIRQLETLRNQQQNSEKQEILLLKQRQILASGDAWLAMHCQDLQNQLHQLEEKLRLEAPFVPMYEASQGLLAQLQTATNARRNRQEKTSELAFIEQEKRQQTETFEKGNKFVKEQQELLSLKEQEVTIRQATLDALHPSETQTAQQQNEQQRDTCTKAFNALSLLLEQKKKETEEQEALSDIRKQQDAYANRQPELLQTYQRSLEQKEEAETLYNRQKEAVEDWAREARSRLHPGDHCPVCGQEIKVLPSDQTFQSSLKPVYDNWQQKKQACELAEKAVHENDANLRSYQKLYDQKSAVVEQTRSRYQEQLRLTLQLCTAYSFTQLTVQELDFLKKHSEALDQERDSIRQKLQDIHRAEQELKNQQQEKDRIQKQLDNANRKLKTIETRLNECRIKEEAVRSFLKSQEQIIGDALEKLRSGMLWNDWEKQWEMNAEALMKRLQQASDDYRQIQENIVRLQKEVDNGAQLERSLEPFRESIQKAFPNWKDIPPVVPQQLSDLHEAWFRFASDCQSLRTVQDGLRESVRQQETILLQFLEKHPDFTREYIQELATYTTYQVEQLRNGQQQAREKAVSLEAAFRQTTGQLERHQADKPALEAEESIGTLTDKQQALDSQSTAIYQEIGQLENRLATDAQNRIRLKDEQALADRLQRIYRQWERLSFHFGDAKGTKFRNIAQSFVLKELLNSANTYLRRLTDRYELACQAGSLTILLRDYYQGGSARPTSTLSGGESFLVSLSLALGLSSLNQHRLSTDMLFIDEGFGTLSEDYLNTVMDTLERLHQLGGKKVGIISHVEGLRERIKTQIQVNRIDNSRSEIRVIRAL